eukprot:4574192-Amphidinium_carterae.7
MHVDSFTKRGDAPGAAYTKAASAKVQRTSDMHAEVQRSSGQRLGVRPALISALAFMYVNMGNLICAKWCLLFASLMAALLVHCCLRGHGKPQNQVAPPIFRQDRATSPILPQQSRRVRVPSEAFGEPRRSPSRKLQPMLPELL